MKFKNDAVMSALNTDIQQGRFRPAYLLCGTEHYLLHQFYENLKNSLLGGGDRMNLLTIEGEDFSLDDVLDFADTLPFLSDRRVIVLKDSGLFASAKKSPLAAYLADVPETATFLFLENAASFGGSKSARSQSARTALRQNDLYKTIASVGLVASFVPETEQTLMPWVNSLVKADGKRITKGAYECLIERTGTDMDTISQEVEKLLCYARDRDVILQEDVLAVTSQQAQTQVFAMVDALSEGRRREALLLYRDLLAQKEEPLVILRLLTNHFQTLLLVKSMSQKGALSKEIAAKIGRPEWTISRQYLRQCRRFSLDAIKRILRESAENEEALKQGNLSPNLAVELLIAGIVGGE